MLFQEAGLTLLFFMTALIYSSVGFGGGSTYLALFYLSGMEYSAIPTAALLCNIIVVSGNTFHQFQKKSIRTKILIPFLITSIPFSFLGGLIPLDKNTFLWILAFSLLTASLRLFISPQYSMSNNLPNWRSSFKIGLPTGSALGLLSGVSGIGGGIFLAPILYFIRWGKPTEIAASASVFILFNSISGILGQSLKNNSSYHLEAVLPLMLAVFVGGQIGTRLGQVKLSSLSLQRITAILIFYVSLQIIWKNIM